MYHPLRQREQFFCPGTSLSKSFCHARNSFKPHSNQMLGVLRRLKLAELFLFFNEKYRWNVCITVVLCGATVDNLTRVDSVVFL